MSTKNSRKVLSVLLAYMMVLSSFSGMAVAAKEDPAATTSYTSEVQKYEKARATDEEVTEVKDSGELRKAIDEEVSYIQLARNIDLTEVSEESEEAETYAAGDADLSIAYELTLDLAGYKLTVNHLNIEADGNLTLEDSEEDGTLTSKASYTVEVMQGGSLTINGGICTNEYDKEGSQPKAIFNGGDLEINGGTVSASTAGTYGTAICNRFTEESKEDDDSKITCTITDGKIESSCWGVTLFGKGLDDEGSYDNDALVLTMSGGTINIVDNNEGQGIATNASGGENAGFTINITGGVVDGGNDGCGMYLPGPGITNISGDACIIGELQGIRIAAGELNIEGGTITNSSRRDDDSDLISGGSGGTAGAIVAGKASAGYVDDLIINIGNATIENTTGGDAIVVSDKNMADSDYEENKIEVTVSESTINGNVYTTSTIDGDDTNDGGNVSVTLNNSTTIEGDIENTSKSPVTATEINLDGTIIVEEDTEGKVTIIDSTVTKDVNTNENIIIVNSTVDEDDNVTTIDENTVYNVDANKLYSVTEENDYPFEEAIAELEAGQTLILGKGTFEVSGDNKTIIDKAGVTIRGVGKETVIDLKQCSSGSQAGILVKADDVTIENLTIKNEADASGNPRDALKFAQDGSGDSIELLESGTVSNVTIASTSGHGLNIHGVKTMNVDNFVVEETGKLSISIANSKTVIISNIKTAKSPWGNDIGIMYDDNGNFGTTSTTVTLSGDNEFANDGAFYTEVVDAADVENGILDSFVIEGGETLYKVLKEKEDGTWQYHYVTSDKIEASIDDELAVENPTGYETLEDAIDAAKDEEEIDLHQDVEDVTINKEVTINGNGNAITGTITVTKEGAEISGANLEDAEFEIEDGTTIDLSGNYWGGEAPLEIEGAVIRTYYDDPKMESPVFIEGENGLLETIKDYLTQKNYTVSSEDYNTEDDVFGWLMEQLEQDLTNFKGDFTVVDSGFTPAEDGTEEEPDGTDGSYTFKVVLSYNGQEVKTEELTVTITAAEYVPDEPEDPDDDDNDNDDDNHGSSGGSSGGGSFIGHPDGWVPGGIIILDGSEQIQPTGSLLLDTKTYTMAPGVVYDILATLEGASENELRVYSSQPGVASVEAIGGGKYRVTGLADGQTYIMFEVWRDGVMLNHASVKVTIADGVTAYGESNREASIF